MRTSRLAIVSFLCAICCNTFAATIEFRNSDPKSPLSNLVLLGEIVAGDAEKIVQRVSEPRRIWSNLIVDSPGGSVAESIKIAKIIKALYVTVEVRSNGRCASACFFIFLAGSGKIASPAELLDPVARAERQELTRSASLRPMEGFVGLHRPYLSKVDGLQNQQVESMRAVAAYLEGQLLSRRLIDIMMSRPSNDIYWLNEEDFADIGEYPPEQEEFFISRCKYDRNYLKKAFAARDRGDSNKALEIVHKADAAQECLVTARFEGTKASVEKLRRGWRPS